MSISKRLFSWFRKLQRSTLLTIFSYLLLGAVIFLSLVSNVRPDQLDVKLLSIAKNTIHSPVTIEDKLTKEKMKREAAQKVEDQYVYRSEYKQNRTKIVDSVFEAAKELRTEKDPLVPAPPVTEQLDKLKQSLPSELTKTIPDQHLLVLLNAPADQFAVAHEFTVTAVNNMMSTHIKINDADEARERIAEELAKANVSTAIKNAMIALGQYAIVPNYFYDPVATSERKQMEMDAVDPVYILQGQVLVKEGDTITREVYEQLELVGLLNDRHAYQPFLGLSLLIVILMYFVFQHFQSFLKRQREDKPYILAYAIIVSLTVFVMKTISLFQQIEYMGIGYLVPVAMGTMLVKLLIGDRFVLLTSIIFSVCGSLMFNEGTTSTFNYAIGLYFLLSSLSVSVFLREKQRRSLILQTGLFVSVLNAAVLGALLFLRNVSISPVEMGIYVLMALASGIISSVLTMGILPYLEGGLGILSTMRLMELASPNSPLLRKILLEAPGTYHHSIMVANLSEASCEAVGANGMLARVGAYYHDIGKTVRPRFFIENQMGNANPHDSLTPEMSRDIIFAHVSEGVKMLNEHKIPREIVAIAAEHHGTTLLKYFYHKAKQEEGHTCIEDMFRYPGPKASSKESAIVGIADSVEAAVRSMNAPTPEQIEKLVRGIIHDRLQDGQFSECNLTFKELKIVEKTLCETLNGIFHSRIQYPKLSEEQEK